VLYCPRSKGRQVKITSMFRVGGLLEMSNVELYSIWQLYRHMHLADNTSTSLLPEYKMAKLKLFI